MKIALIGTRGVPARYGGFETAVEEVGLRLAKWGHDVTVYSRGTLGTSQYLGMEVVSLPTIRLKVTDTLVHTALSVGHSLTRRYDAVLVFNAANAPIATLLKLRRVPYAVHLDGLESKRLKWGYLGRRYYLWAERVAARSATALIADARAIQDYHRHAHSAEALYIAYGAPTPSPNGGGKIAQLGLSRGQYHLLVARFEPENYVDLIVESYRASLARLPLVVVGAAPYNTAYAQRIQIAAAGDSRIRFLGSVWDQELLDDLYLGCASYAHGHSVGGTNPSLLRAMGMGAPVLARDVIFNREVLGEYGRFFSSARELALLFEWVEQHVEEASELAGQAQNRARALYDWDDVARRYERLCACLADGGVRARVNDRDLIAAPAMHRTNAKMRTPEAGSENLKRT